MKFVLQNLLILLILSRKIDIKVVNWLLDCSFINLEILFEKFICLIELILFFFKNLF
jgi:hypothetical protein